MTTGKIRLNAFHWFSLLEIAHHPMNAKCGAKTGSETAAFSKKKQPLWWNLQLFMFHIFFGKICRSAAGREERTAAEKNQSSKQAHRHTYDATFDDWFFSAAFSNNAAQTPHKVPRFLKMRHFSENAYWYATETPHFWCGVLDLMPLHFGRAQNISNLVHFLY